jgi:hypothetical protein
MDFDDYLNEEQGVSNSEDEEFDESLYDVLILNMFDPK